MRAPSRASLQVIHSPDPSIQGRSYPLGADEIFVGREAVNSIVIASDQASRRHARIFLMGGSHVVQDLESTNGTFVNSKAVREQPLRSGDVIRIASTVLKYLVEG
jgi:pSer/pThr/pTyr-binding forkhead associated (FHA) protein